VPNHNEVLAALDALWNHRDVRTRYDGQDYSTISKVSQLFGKSPRRPDKDMAAAKLAFEKMYYKSMYEALEQADKIRAHKTLNEIYPVNANVIGLGNGKYAVEIFINRSSPELIDGFDSHSAAANWVTKNADAYVEKKGAPVGTKVVRVWQN
jgi:hypothetical protein